MNTIFFYRGLQNRGQRTDFRPQNRGTHFENRGLPAPILTNINRCQDNNWLDEKKEKPFEGGAH